MSCKDCSKRYPACHDTCKDYLDYKQTCIDKNIARNNYNTFCRSEEVSIRKNMWSTHKNR